MKTIIDNYTFNPIAKTITFNDTGIIFNKIQQIKNLTVPSQPIYASYDTTGTVGGTFSGNILTIQASTAGMASTDNLQITYESPNNIVQQGDLSHLNDSVATRGLSTVYDNLSGSALNAVLFQEDVSNYTQIDAVITSIGGSNFVQIAFSPDSNSWTAYKTIGAATTLHLPRKGKYMRMMINSYTSGTVTAKVVLYANTTTLGIDKVGYPVPTEAFYLGMQDNAGNVAPVYSFAGIGDNASGNKPLGVGIAGFDGANASRLRTPNTRKPFNVSVAGNSAVWTPTTGKKFRLLGYHLACTQNAARSGTGQVIVKFQDGTNDINIQHSVFVPTTAATTMDGGWTTGWVDLGGLGVLSTAANNVLSINLSIALTAGVFTGYVVGTEE